MRRLRIHILPLFTILFIVSILITFTYFITREEENFILGESLSNVDLLFKNSSLKAYIVEEHHEVLQYWFEAARRKIIPESGNTLIHIDGHSDMGLPLFFYEFPYFRRPTNKYNIHVMMQRNDIFIVAAAMTGLINRVVWVWPIWDKINHNSQYTIYNVEIGITSIKYPDDQREFRLFCICDRNVLTQVKTCKRMSLERKDVLEEIEMDSRLCHIKRSIQFEEMNEYEAKERASGGKLVLQNETVILDIDEDYFGCTYACKPLLDQNISLASIDKINKALEKLICPKTLSEEAKADDILGFVLQLISDCFNGMERHVFKSCSRDKIKKKAIKLLNKFLWSSENNLGCSSNKGALEIGAMQDLLNVFMDLNYQQLMSLKKVGFCFTTSLKSFQLTMTSVFHICKGHNDPLSSSVFIHVPTIDEISLRTRILETIIKSIHVYSKIQFVTVCRSIRDGYTPREYFKHIESELFGSLRKCFENKNLEFKFDGGLLGGVHGWPNKEKRMFKQINGDQ